jgi:hypothetical protein
MKKIASILFVAVLVVSLSSCVSRYEYRSAKSTSFTPNRVELKQTMTDYEYLGDVQVSIQYKTYLGFITHIEAINELPYNRHEKKIVNIRGDKDVAVSCRIRQALYKVLDTFPDADYYIPVKSVEKIDNLFLGKSISYVVTVKCYKLK